MFSSWNEPSAILMPLLHFNRLGQYVDLPRVVLVGENDSAKLTVLMALTGLPMPKEYLGNDFTMEFILIPSETKSIKMVSLPTPPTPIRDETMIEKIVALRDEMNCEDLSWEGLFEFLFGRMILKLRLLQKKDFSMKDMIRVEVRLPLAGPMIILDLPQWPCRNKTGWRDDDWMASQIRKSRNIILVAHDGLSTVKISRLDSLLRDGRSFSGGGNRTMAVFVARPACLTSRDALQVKAVVQTHCSGHDFSFGWFILEEMGDQEGQVSQVRTSYTREGQTFTSWYPNADRVYRLYQSLKLFDNVMSKLSSEGFFDVSKISGEVEQALRFTGKKRTKSCKKSGHTLFDIRSLTQGVAVGGRLFDSEGFSLERFLCLMTASKILSSFDQQNTSPPPSSASSTIELKYTPTESSADETKVHDAND